jgi:hypothetical protein
MKIYVLYCLHKLDNDFKIIEIFTEEKLAKRALLLCPDKANFKEYGYEEWETVSNLEYPENCRAYRVNVVDGKVTEKRILPFLEDRYMYEPVMNTANRYGNISTVYCWATDDDHAEQVAMSML